MQRSLVLLLKFIFSPNPTALAHYSDPAQVGLLVMCGVLIMLSFIISRWRKKTQNAVTRKLSKSWSSMCLWMGVVGLVLVVARVERIQIIAMPLFWVIWFAIFIAYAILQWRLFAMRHYEVMPRNLRVDPRERYLPRKK